MSWRGQPFKLSRRQARGLIYYLAGDLTPASRDRLCFLFWPDVPEAEARRKLSRLVSLLRGDLPQRDLLLVDNETIGFNPELVWSDAAEFIRLHEKPSPLSRETAVDIYRGIFLDGFSLPQSPEYDFWLSEEGARFENIYLSTLAELVKSKTQSHDLAAAIQYAHAYLAVDELAEDIHRQLITLYAANGDQPAAMRQFEACTLALERELGVEPLPETRAAFDAVRSGEWSLQPALKTKPAWTVLPSLDLPLIGREEAWESLESAYRRFQNGGLIFISGEPGIGKSRLLQEFATGQESLVLSGNCHASTQTLPYQPVLQALRQALSLPQLWDGIRPIWLTETGRLLPELADHFPDLPPPIDVEPDQAQARLYEALTQCFLGLTNNAPTLLCLDDVHWVDETTMGWLTYLSGRLAGSGLCILATYRVEEKSFIVNLEGSFSRINLLAEVSLAGLTKEAILELLEQLPEPPPQPKVLATRIYGATGGNPFFVLETVRVLMESDLTALSPTDLPLADTVQAAILRRLDRLSPISRQTLEAAAVLSPNLDFRLLQETTGRSELEVADGLDELLKRQIFQEGKSGAAFRHDLLRTTIYQLLNPWRRQTLHRRAGDVLGNMYARGLETVAAQMAQHYDAAGAFEPAVEYYELAAKSAQAVYAHEEAIRLLQRAIALVTETNHEVSIVANLHESLGDSSAFIGRYLEAFEGYQSALEFIPISVSDKRGNLLRKQASSLVPQQKFGEAINLYKKTIEDLRAWQDIDSKIWSHLWLETHLDLMDALYFQALPEEMSQVSRDIQGMLDQFGTPSQQFKFIGILDRIQMRQSRYRPTATTVEHRWAILEHQMKTGNPVKVASAHFGYAFVLLWHGNLSKARHHFTEGLSLAEKFAYGLLQVQCRTYLMILHRLQGQTPLVREMWPSTYKVAKEVGFPMYIASSLANRAWLNYRKRQWDAAKVDAQTAQENWGSSPYPFKWLAYWVLLATALHENQMEDAIKASDGMLEPSQQHLSDDVMDALEGADERWKAQDETAACAFLEQAVGLAQEKGYL